MKIRLTNYSGDSRTLTLANAEQFHVFVAEYPKRLRKGSAVKVECSALAFDKWIHGEAQDA